MNEDLQNSLDRLSREISVYAAQARSMGRPMKNAELFLIDTLMSLPEEAEYLLAQGHRIRAELKSFQVQ
ncbi:MAG: hypothetical protein ACI4PW_06655 [Alphaproteobacteria bacterium]